MWRKAPAGAPSPAGARLRALTRLWEVCATTRTMSASSNLALAGFIMIGAAVLSPSLPSDPWDAPAVSEADDSASPGAKPAAAAQPGTTGPRELRRAPDGHFYAVAQVNGASINFMVDTGASIVALTPEDAQRAGIHLPDTRAVARGLGGEVEVIPVTIDRLSLGGLEARSVRAAVADELPISLLGQNVLSQIGTVEIRGDRMVLR
jgi:aspartyl protease family protein